MIIADLRGARIEPEEREECMMSVMSGKREGRWSLTRFVGRGSRLQVEIKFLNDVGYFSSDWEIEIRERGYKRWSRKNAVFTVIPLAWGGSCL